MREALSGNAALPSRADFTGPADANQEFIVRDYND
jgi:hypothetical protein